MDPRKETTSGPGSVLAPKQANDSHYRPDHSSEPGQKRSLMQLPGAEREAILNDIQTQWSHMPTPPSAADVNRWIKAGRRGE